MAATFTALAYVADRLIVELRSNGYPDDLRIEITFTPDALRAVVAQRPEVLGIKRLHGVSVTFPEKPLPHHQAFQSGVDWCMTLIDEHGATNIGINRYGPLGMLVDT